MGLESGTSAGFKSHLLLSFCMFTDLPSSHLGMPPSHFPPPPHPCIDLCISQTQLAHRSLSMLLWMLDPGTAFTCLHTSVPQHHHGGVNVLYDMFVIPHDWCKGSVPAQAHLGVCPAIMILVIPKFTTDTYFHSEKKLSERGLSLEF